MTLQRSKLAVSFPLGFLFKLKARDFLLSR